MAKRRKCVFDCKTVNRIAAVVPCKLDLGSVRVNLRGLKVCGGAKTARNTCIVVRQNPRSWKGIIVIGHLIKSALKVLAKIGAKAADRKGVWPARCSRNNAGQSYRPIRDAIHIEPQLFARTVPRCNKVRPTIQW